MYDNGTQGGPDGRETIRIATPDEAREADVLGFGNVLGGDFSPRVVKNVANGFILYRSISGVSFLLTLPYSWSFVTYS